MTVRNRETLPQGTVASQDEPVDQAGPCSFDDMVTHTGEARGVADTAYHSLDPDAPTVGAAQRGHEIARDLGAGHSIPSSSTGPD